MYTIYSTMNSTPLMQITINLKHLVFMKEYKKTYIYIYNTFYCSNRRIQFAIDIQFTITIQHYQTTDF